MADLKAIVPLSFAIALSSVLPNAANGALGDPSELLRPGSLQNLARLDEPLIGHSAGAARDNSSAKRQIAQTCWSGQWRRC